MKKVAKKNTTRKHPALRRPNETLDAWARRTGTLEAHQHLEDRDAVAYALKRNMIAATLRGYMLARADDVYPDPAFVNERLSKLVLDLARAPLPRDLDCLITDPNAEIPF